MQSVWPIICWLGTYIHEFMEMYRFIMYVNARHAHEKISKSDPSRILLHDSHRIASAAEGAEGAGDADGEVDKGITIYIIVVQL